MSKIHFILTTMYQKSLELLQKSEEINEIWHIDNEQDRAIVKALLDNSPTPTPAMKELLALTEGIKDLTHAV